MKIMILVNKDFEYAGYRSGVEYQITAGKTPNVHIIRRDYRTGPLKSDPSCVYTIGEEGKEEHGVREFCIQYLFGKDENSSNSERKYMYLNKLIAKEMPDLIISVSTSESTPEAQGTKTENGSVFVGHRFYAKDCKYLEDKKDPPSKLIFDRYWNSTDSMLDEVFFKQLYEKLPSLAKGMEEVPNNPSKNTRVIANENDISLGVVNIVTYKLYEKADKATYEEYKEESEIPSNPVCLETTHAVVKMAAENIGILKRKNIPVLFVSPIVDRYLQFSNDVDESWGKQNKFGSYNAGVVVANMMELVIKQLK